MISKFWRAHWRKYNSLWRSTPKLMLKMYLFQLNINLFNFILRLFNCSMESHFGPLVSPNHCPSKRIEQNSIFPLESIGTNSFRPTAIKWMRRNQANGQTRFTSVDYHLIGFKFANFKSNWKKLFTLFQSTVDESTEKVFKRIFSEYGDVTLVDIPQCDPLRKQMESEISGIQCSSWLFGQVQDRI